MPSLAPGLLHEPLVVPMRRSKSIEAFASGGKNPKRWRPYHLLLALASVYLFVMAFRFRHLLQFDALDRPQPAAVHHETLNRKLSSDPARPKPVADDPLVSRARGGSYGRITGEMARRRGRRNGWSGNRTALEAMASDAWSLGAKAWEEVQNFRFNESASLGDLLRGRKETEPCPSSVSLNGKKFMNGKRLGLEKKEMMLLPCGLEVGSSITVIGTPENAHKEHVPQLVRNGERGWVMVSQFMVELQGLTAVDGEDPPRILHFNPRLKGDWSKMPVIEMNTCYRMQWGKSMRCDGLPSEEDDDTVDGFEKCEKWERNGVADLKESKPSSWLNRFIGRAKKPEMAWPFPFAEGKLFVLTLQAGMEGYHIHVGGRHVASFLYRSGFSLEDATGLVVKGNVDVHSVYATSLPKSHPSYSVQNILEPSEKWKSSYHPDGPVHLFVGVLSSTNHFAERMAIRKTWMQYPDVKSSYVVIRFFVALGPRKETNAMLKKEADFFGDIVILPFMDHYELVVLKTIAICEYGIHNVTAAYIMKCDDDNFVRLDAVLRSIDKVADKGTVYMGNLNLKHRPQRSGKWAVTYEEWPEHAYPPYANGPGYIISNDIARYIVSKHANHSLRIFKMEDVSMGMWVEEFNASRPVRYLHSWAFCQYGCMPNYITAHYQSPKQMICLWDKLAAGQAGCCNF